MPEAFPQRGRRWHEAALRRAAQRAAFLIVPSRDTAAAVLGAGVGIGEKRLVVVPEGSDHLGEADLPGAAALLARLGVKGPYLLTVSTLEPRKNLRRLVEAYELARPQLPEPWPLLVVGPSGWGAAATPAGIGASEGVIFAGDLDTGVLAAVYSGARCCAYVPILEGFGLPVVEAMAQGTPVVSSPVPSAAGASLEVEPTDVGSIAEGLVVAAGDEATRSRLKAAGLARTAQLSWVATARAHVAVWERVAKENEAR
jgi:glycosyltransferase involved in cell wall biosynthesis